MRVLFAGGGTAGHVLPAIAVAGALERRGVQRTDLRFSGAAKGMERDLVPAAGYACELLEVQGFAPRPSLANLRALVALVRATGSAWRSQRRFRPAAVVSVGGYASLPPVLAAVVRRTPVVALAYEVVPGKAIRLSSRFAAATATAFPDVPVPRARHTGAPVRPEVLAADRSPEGRRAARLALGLPPERSVVLAVGGSLGSGTINAVTDALCTRLADRSDVAVHQVVGTRNAALVPTGAAGVGQGLVRSVVPYESRMGTAYAAADVVLARSGASTVAELAAVGIASVLVPWPDAADDHQSANAHHLADAGGAVVVDERGRSLADTIDAAVAAVVALLDDPVRRAAMEAAATTLGRPDAAERIADLVVEVAR